MKRYFGLIILVVGISCATSYNQNDTKHHEVNLQEAQITAPNHLTVETEMEQSKTMTDARGQGEVLAQGRTFGLKHRLQSMLLPLMYKLGVMTTLLVILVVVSLKSLLIGILLLGLKVGAFISKFHQPQSHQPIWSPPPQSWQPPQPVHVHWHQDDHPSSYSHHSPYDRQDQQVQGVVYSGWDQLAASNPYQKPIAIDNYGQYVYRG